MRLAAVQYRAGRDGDADLPASWARLHALADEAAADADLVVLPELAATGYVLEPDDPVAHARRIAEPADGGQLPALAAIARARGAWIVGGYVEAAGAHLFNAARVVAPDGSLAASYHKTLLFEEDMPWATPGTPGDWRVFDTGVGTFSVGICMDLNDPRFIWWLRRVRPDAVAFPTAWLEEGADVWRYWQARIGGTGVTLVAGDTWGVHRHLRFVGSSAVLDERTVWAGLGRTGDGIARGRVGEP